MGALLVLLVGPVVVVAGGLGLLHLAVTGIAEVLGRGPGHGTRRRGVVKLGLVALAAGAPLLALRWAERRNGWVDRDGDGMLDGMANGGYDWVDVNLGDFLRIWFLLAIPLAVAGYLASTGPPRRPRPEARNRGAVSRS